MKIENLSEYIEGADLRVKTRRGNVVKRIYFNNSATPLALKNVVKDINRNIPVLTYINATGKFGKINTLHYENVREIILDLIGGDYEKDCVIYVENATEGINLLADFIKEKSPNKIVVTTDMEHMSNYLPFKSRFNIKSVGLTKNKDIDFKDLEKILKENAGNVSLVAITAVSNITGEAPDIYYAAKLAHKYGAKILVDIVQMIQHNPFEMKSHDSDEHIDFAVFSAHKCYSPLNGGALIGPYKFFKHCTPVALGPGPAEFVSKDRIIYSKPPERFEAGYPDYFGTIAMGKALLSLQQIGIKRISAYERKLYTYMKTRLKELSNVEVYCSNSENIKIPNFAFNVKGVYHKDVVKYLVCNYGIEVTSGVMGADIYVQSLLNITPKEAYLKYKTENPVGVIRASLGMYNTFAEVDRLIYALSLVR